MEDSTIMSTTGASADAVSRAASARERWGVDIWIERGRRDPLRGFSIAAAVGLAVGALLATFGMPPLDLHAPPHYWGIMDPLCGMTRGSAATLRGDLAEAWWYNPASPLVILGGILVLARWVFGRLTGVWIRARWHFTRLSLTVVGVLVVVLEINQQLHVDRLR